MMQAMKAIGVVLGMAFSIVVDAAFFGILVAIPLSALFVLGLISKPVAIAIITLVAIIAAIRVIFVSVLKLL